MSPIIDYRSDDLHVGYDRSWRLYILRGLVVVSCAAVLSFWIYATDVSHGINQATTGRAGDASFVSWRMLYLYAAAPLAALAAILHRNRTILHASALFGLVGVGLSIEVMLRLNFLLGFWFAAVPVGIFYYYYVRTCSQERPGI
jgi:hypothetical protein